GPRRKMLEVAENAMMADSLPIEIHEDDAGARQRRGNVSRRGAEQRKQAKQIGNQDKDADRTNQGDVRARVTPCAVIKNIPYPKSHRIGKQEFPPLLQRSGTLHGKTGLQNQHKDQHEKEDQRRHNYRLWDGQLRVLRLDMQRLEER